MTLILFQFIKKWKGLEERDGEIKNSKELVFELHFCPWQLPYIRIC